jgi:molecular chaperone HtpG
LVATEYGWNANMERIIKSQALRNNEMDELMESKRVLEINLNHKIIKTLKDKYTKKKFKKQCNDVVLLMFDTALVNSGFMLEQPSNFANKVNKMIESDFCLK